MASVGLLDIASINSSILENVTLPYEETKISPIDSGRYVENSINDA